MAKRKVEVRILSHGLYRQWDSEAKDLPQIVEFTTEFPAVVGIEFGFVANVKGAKNQRLSYCIDHPGILDDQGQRRSPFEGTVYVKTQDWNFYLGDTIWEPLHDKLGSWRMWIALDGKVVAEKTFELY